MEFSVDSAFNSPVSIFANSGFRLRLVATLFLAMLALQAAQASPCCEIDLDATGEMAASGSMPCHGDDESDEGNSCCLTCVTMAPVSQLSATLRAFHQTVVASPAHLETHPRPDLPYRPPAHHLS